MTAYTYDGHETVSEGVPMVGKQIAITPEQQQRIAALASCWHCTDDEVIRRAIDRLPDPESAAGARNSAFRAVARCGSDGTDLPSDEEIQRLEADSDAWFASHPQARGLSDTILKDRR